MYTGPLTKQERYIAASMYLFELGYVLAYATKTESAFITFHTEQFNRAALRLAVPGSFFVLLSFFFEQSGSIAGLLIMVGLLFFAVLIVVVICGVHNALRGEMKKLPLVG